MRIPIAGLLPVLLLVVSCTSVFRLAPVAKLRAPMFEPVELNYAHASLAERPNLNISLETFTSTLKVSSPIYSSATRIRSVETRYLPYVLKRTLDLSQYWGAVRVLPRADPSAELQVSGTILSSDGVELRLLIKVTDATGQVWLDNLYHETATDLHYGATPHYLDDPFQNLFNRIANDLSARLQLVSTAAQQHILDMAMLSYAVALSPASFSGYLADAQDGELKLLSLPARDDPLLSRVDKIRQGEYLFTDGVDAQYELLFRQLGPTYAWWRHYSYELIIGNEKLEQIDATRGATRGSWYAMERIYKTYKESKMNEDALRELTLSFDNETRPLVTQIAGKVIELSGTLDMQYDEWRRILRDIYREETGF